MHTFPNGRWTTVPAGTDQKVIKLHIRGRSWFAQFSGPEAEKLQGLFGTTDFCTAFKASVPESQVRAEIAALNFDYTVTV